MDNIITMKEQIQLFEDRKVRTVWDEEQEKWYFSIVDVVEVLTDSADPTSHTPPVIPCLTRNLIIWARPESHAHRLLVKPAMTGDGPAMTFQMIYF